MNASDRVRAQHMLDAAREALSFVQGRTREYIPKDRLLTLALIKEIEVLGEAAAKLSPEFKQSRPSIPRGGDHRHAQSPDPRLTLT